MTGLQLRYYAAAFALGLVLAAMIHTDPMAALAAAQIEIQESR
jgi:hypothetical protein